MTETHLSLLDDAFISVRGPDNSIDRWTLPDVLSGLQRREVSGFTLLQPHQKQPWYCLLVQVAAMGLARRGSRYEELDSQGWRQVLLELSEESEAAWCLVVEDLYEPAFLQSPVPEGSLDDARYKPVATPDELDILVTAKNHDVKQNRISDPMPEHWLFSLITLQTLEGFLGRGNYGIVRMNGGFSSRPFVGLAPGLGWGTRFSRDVALLLNERPGVIERYGYDQNGHALLWLDSWDGSKDDAIPLASCDPYFVEICRRIRFTWTEGAIAAHRTNTKGARIDAHKDLNGVTGDPWTPINAAKSKALTLSGQGFHYRLLRQLMLSEEYVRSAAMEVDSELDDGGYLLASCLVRGQGKTEGYFERVVPFPSKATSLFGEPEPRQRLFKIAKRRVDLAGDVRRSVLYPALLNLLSAGGDAQVDSDEVARWTNGFDRSVDAVYFSRLWEDLELEEFESRRLWEGVLYELARAQLEDAMGSAPLPSARRYRALSSAESIFEGSARNHLKAYFHSEQKDEPSA